MAGLVFCLMYELLRNIGRLKREEVAHGLAPALPGFCRSIQARFFDGRRERGFR